jgi:hypothetical protein
VLPNGEALEATHAVLCVGGEQEGQATLTRHGFTAGSALPHFAASSPPHPPAMAACDAVLDMGYRCAEVSVDSELAMTQIAEAARRHAGSKRRRSNYFARCERRGDLTRKWRAQIVDWMRQVSVWSAAVAYGTSRANDPRRVHMNFTTSRGPNPRCHPTNALDMTSGSNLTGCWRGLGPGGP